MGAWKLGSGSHQTQLHSIHKKKKNIFLVLFSEKHKAGSVNSAQTLKSLHMLLSQAKKMHLEFKCCIINSTVHVFLILI